MIVPPNILLATLLCAGAAFVFLRLVAKGVIRFTIDQQPYIQGFYPVIQLTLLLRYGIQPSDIDAGATVITKTEAARAMKLKKLNSRSAFASCPSTARSRPLAA